MMTTYGSSNSNPSCEHFVGIDENKVSLTTTQCEECEKEGTDWVAYVCVLFVVMLAARLLR